ncbi:MAG: ktr system potassium uptake protein C [Pirellulaceae bacterium]|nr:MAG: ktr system potassium uptake protein C [Pirellulaceae bacterium]
MPETKHFVVIGLGTFGAALVRRLQGWGCRVTGVDSEEDHVKELKDELYEAIIGDATERETLEHLPLKDANAVIISLGDDITRSLLAALHAKDLGAKRIVVKAVSNEHARILKALGVEVVHPEREFAEAYADRMSLPNLVGSLYELEKGYAMAEISVPDWLTGKTLQEADLRRRYRVNVVAVRGMMRGTFVIPEADYRFGPDESMLVVGRLEDITRLGKLQNQS